MDGNARTRPASPWIGLAGSRCQEESCSWNSNGRAFLELLQEHHLSAISTFGSQHSRSWTWISPQGLKTRLDYIVTKGQASAEDCAWVDYEMPVSMSGYRDHRPLLAQFRLGAHFQRKGKLQPKFCWDRCRLHQAADQLQRFNDGADFSLGPEGQAGARVIQAVEAGLHRIGSSQMLNGEAAISAIEDIVVRSAAAEFQQPDGRRRSKRPALSRGTVALINRKHDILRFLGQQHGRLDAEQQEYWTAQLIHVQREARREVRRDKRREVERLLDVAQGAAQEGNTKELFKLIHRLAPQPKGGCDALRGGNGVCWDAEAEMDERARALHLIFDGQEHEVSAQPPREFQRDPGGWQWMQHGLTEAAIIAAVNRLANNKAGPATRLPVDNEAATGAVAEVWKLVISTAVPWIRQAWQACCTSGRISSLFKNGEICFLPKPGKDASDAVKGWRTINLLNHLGKAFVGAILEPTKATLRGGLRQNQFGALPQRGTRDAIAVVEDVLQRFRQGRGLRGQNRRGPRLMAVVLFDLEKAFDKVPRQMVWGILREKARGMGVDAIFQELHDGTCYLLCNAQGEIKRRIWIKKGVRQGSIEGPLVFICLYDMILLQLAQSRPAARRLTAKLHQQLFDRGSADEIEVGDIAFVDDLITMIEFDEVADLTAWIDQVADVFGELGMQANLDKLELLLQAYGTGSKQLNAKVRSGKYEITLRDGTLIRAQRSAKYLGVQLVADGRHSIEVGKRLQKAEWAHRLLSQRIWKNASWGPQLLTRVWTVLVRSILLYGMETHTLRGRDLSRLEKFQNKCLRHIGRSPVHLTRETTAALRRRLQVPTVASVVRKQRLGWWRKTLQAGYLRRLRPGQQPQPLRGSWDFDPSQLLRTVLLGRLSFEAADDDATMTDRQALLLSDLGHLRDKLQLIAADSAHQLQSVCCQALQALGSQRAAQPTVSRQWIEWLARLPATVLEVVLEFDDGTSDSQAPMVQCSCGRWCQGDMGLKVHRSRWCPQTKEAREQARRDQESARASVKTKKWTCGRCLQTFARRDGWTKHVQRCCE